MLQKLLLITLTLCSLTATAQWQQTGSKVRYVNGLGIPTKDTAAGVAADSSQILIRPADSSLYVKYKRTWLRVGGGGGSIAGSGTTNYIPKFTSSTAIGNSQIFDNGTNIGIGTASPAYKLDVNGTTLSNQYRITPSGTSVLYNIVNSDATFAGVYALQAGGGSSGFGGSLMMYGHSHATKPGWITAGISVGSNGKFSVNNQALGGGTDIFVVEQAGNVGIGTSAPSAKLSVQGTTLINTNTDNGVDKLQVSGSVYSSSTLKGNDISIVGTGSIPTLTSTQFLTQSFSAQTTAKTANYTTAFNDYFIDCTSGTFTVTLQAAASYQGRILIIKNSGAGTITVDGNAAETIDGAATYALSVQYATVQIMSDGTNWKIIAKF